MSNVAYLIVHSFQSVMDNGSSYDNATLKYCY